MIFSKDQFWKSIIEDFIEDFLHFFLPKYTDAIDFIKPIEFLDTELQKLSRGIEKAKE